MCTVEAGGKRERDKIFRHQGRVLLHSTGYGYGSSRVEVRKRLFREGEHLPRLQIYDCTLDGQWKGSGTTLMEVYEQTQENGMDLAWRLVLYRCHDELAKIEQLKSTQMYYLIVLQVRSLMPWVSRAEFLTGCPWGESVTWTFQASKRLSLVLA